MALNLSGVQLEATLGLGVTVFPFLTLGIETFEPFVGLRIKALGEDVVTLLVVGVGHAVLRRVKVLGVVLISLLQGQGDAATLKVNVDDLDHCFFVDADNLVRHLNVTLCQFGDVNQTLDALFDADERTERNQLGDLTRNDLANSVGASKDAPRIFHGGLQGQGDALAIKINVKDLDGDFVANSDNLGRMINVLPGQLGNVNQSVHTAQIDECAEVDDGGHNALADLALLKLVQELRANLRLGLLKPCTTGQHNIVAVLVQLDDLCFDFLADVRIQVTNATHLNKRCRKETAEADVQNEAALDNLNDSTGDRLVLLLEFLNGTPSALVLCALLGEDEAAFLVLLGQNQCINFVANLDDLARIDIVLDGKFARRNHTFGFVADVEQYLVAVNLNDGTFHDIAIVEVLDGCVDCGEEVLSGANVIDGNLRGVVGGHM